MAKPIEKRLLDDIGRFTGSINTHIERYGDIIREQTINRPKDEGLTLHSLEDVIRASREALAEMAIPLPEPCMDTLHLALKKLGKTKEKKGLDSSQEAVKSALQMAHILSAYSEEITISAVSRHQGGGTVSDFVVSVPSDGAESLLSMMRGAYGRAETEHVQAPPKYSLRVSAAGRFVFPGKEKNKQEKEYKRYISWAASVLRALPSGEAFTVSMRFCPLEDKSRLEEMHRQLGEFCNELKFYSEIQWGNSTNFGSNINHKKNLIATSVEKVKGVIRDNDELGENFGTSMNLGGQEINKEALLLIDELEFAMNRMTQAQETGAWVVGVSASAENPEVLQTITAVVSGTLEESGLWLDWTDGAAAGVIASAEELLPLLRFPDQEFAGFQFVENDDFSLVSPGNETDGFYMGDILWNDQPIAPFHLSPKALSRHAFICGMTGAGKTNTLFKLIEGVDLPFCVIEPVKGEYRALKSTYSDLKIWTMKVAGSGEGRVMQINPFWFPADSNLAFHIDSIKTIISSAFELSAAMPNILEQCMYNIYVNAGWDLVTNQNRCWGQLPEDYLFPTFSDLCVEIEDYLDRSDFDAEVLGNYKGALLTRIKSFVNGYKGILLNTNRHPDYAAIMNGHSVIELEGLADDADKCLVMGTILVQYYQYLKLHFSSQSNGQDLRHITVIEEAHRLFKNTQKKTSNGEGSGSDPTGQLVDSLSNMMAEIRAFGEGMLIVDQSPTKLADDVVKNSATKIIHRIDNGDDIKVLQSPMLLPEDLISFAALKQGQALVRTDGMTKPCKVMMTRSNIKEDYSLEASFRTAGEVDQRLAGLFAATSILYNEELCREVQEQLVIFLNSLSLVGADCWYSLCSDLLYDVIQILRKYKVYDVVDYRLAVLADIITLSLKRMTCFESKKDLGQLHLFLTRVLQFFREQKDGRYIKSGVVELFQEYLQNHIVGIMEQLSQGRSEVYAPPAASRIPEKNNTLCASVFMRFIEEVAPALDKEEISAEQLAGAFLANKISFTAQAYVWDTYGELLEKLGEQQLGKGR